jgi:hypothetical protein
MNPSPYSSRRKPRKVRYHDHEWERVVRHAQACGLPTATFVRRVSLGAKPRARRNRTENDLILQLGRLATDLHRLVNLSEQGNASSSSADLERLLNEILAAVRRIG